MGPHRQHFFQLEHPEKAWTHVRLSIYPGEFCRVPPRLARAELMPRCVTRRRRSQARPPVRSSSFSVPQLLGSHPARLPRTKGQGGRSAQLHRVGRRQLKLLDACRAFLFGPQDPGSPTHARRILGVRLSDSILPRPPLGAQRRGDQARQLWHGVQVQPPGAGDMGAARGSTRDQGGGQLLCV